MQPRILDGTAIAAEIKAETRSGIAQCAARGIVPGLAVVLVGNDPASEIYVRSKVRTSNELGIHGELITPPATITEAELLALIAELNGRDDIDGILVQLPLPPQIDTRRVLEAVSPAKDVDGFHPINVGRLQIGQETLAPCTPAGIMEILRRSDIPVRGRDCVMIGRSDIVGKPASTMLLNAGATVAVCHKETRDLAMYTRQADILVVATGVPGLVQPHMIKPGAVLIDVGINRLDTPEQVERYLPGNAAKLEALAKRGFVLTGDVDPRCYPICGAYTPVPGGVGALTIAMLMQTTLKAARMRRGLV